MVLMGAWGGPLWAAFFIFSIWSVWMLSRGNNTGKMKRGIAEEFRPLTYIEIKQDKPFIVRMTKKWSYVCRLQKTKNLIKLFHGKNVITEYMNKKKDYITGFLSLYKLLYDISEKPRGLIKRIRYKSFLYKYFYNNSEVFLNLYNDMLDYQTRLFFLLKIAGEKVMTQEIEYTKINSGLSWQAGKGTPQFTSHIFQSLN